MTDQDELISPERRGPGRKRKYDYSQLLAGNVPIPAIKAQVADDQKQVVAAIKRLPKFDNLESGPKVLYGRLQQIAEDQPAGYHENVLIGKMKEACQKPSVTQEDRNDLHLYLEDKHKLIFKELNQLEAGLNKLRQSTPITDMQAQAFHLLPNCANEELEQILAHHALGVEEVRYIMKKRKILSEDVDENEGCMIESLGSIERRWIRRTEVPYDYDTITLPVAARHAAARAAVTGYNQ